MDQFAAWKNNIIRRYIASPCIDYSSIVHYRFGNSQKWQDCPYGYAKLEELEKWNLGVHLDYAAGNKFSRIMDSSDL